MYAALKDLKPYGLDDRIRIIFPDQEEAVNFFFRKNC